MKIRAWDLIVASALGGAAAMMAGAGPARAASNPPLSGSWNIQSEGSAESSGEMLFRVTPVNGDDPIEVTVSVLSGSNEDAVARKIQRTLASQLRPDRFNVALGAGPNVLVTDQRGQPNFSLELLTSDVENVRIAVQSTQPAATPTVPAQTAPASVPAPATPPGPGDAVPPVEAPPTPSPPDNPAPPPASGPSSVPIPAPPPNATGGAGQPARAPPPG